MDKKLMELRKEIKRRKPYFISQDSYRRKRIRKRWRRPKGLHSKMRLQTKGHRKLVKPGYGSPRAVYGLHHSGLEIIRVSSEKCIREVNKEKQGIVVASAVGLRKKIELIKKAKVLGINILNIKDIDSFLKNAEEEIKKRKEGKDAKLKKKKEKESAKKTPAKKKEEKLSEKLSEEDKKEIEKKEKDKILTKKEIQ